jgi:Ca2+-binding RTX toxin-like protein
MLDMLEPRRLFAVTVSEGYPGVFEITGGDSADVIQGTVSQQNNTLTIDGNTYNDVWYISVNAGGGNDTISLTTTAGAGCIGAGIDAGAGDDTISLNFDGSIYAGSGNDTLNLADSFRGEAYGGTGDDHIIVAGECVNAAIQGDSGDDLIDCSNNNYSVTVHGGTGNDTIYGSQYDDEIWGDQGTDSLVGNSGNDTFFSRDGSQDVVVGGAGTDVAYANGSETSMTGVEYVYYS